MYKHLIGCGILLANISHVTCHFQSLFRTALFVLMPRNIRYFVSANPKTNVSFREQGFNKLVFILMNDLRECL